MFSSGLTTDSAVLLDLKSEVLLCVINELKMLTEYTFACSLLLLVAAAAALKAHY